MKLFGHEIDFLDGLGTNQKRRKRIKPTTSRGIFQAHVQISESCTKIGEPTQKKTKRIKIEYKRIRTN